MTLRRIVFLPASGFNRRRRDGSGLSGHVSRMIGQSDRHIFNGAMPPRARHYLPAITQHRSLTIAGHCQRGGIARFDNDLILRRPRLSGIRRKHPFEGSLAIGRDAYPYMLAGR